MRAVKASLTTPCEASQEMDARSEGQSGHSLLGEGGGEITEKTDLAFTHSKYPALPLCRFTKRWAES